MWSVAPDGRAEAAGRESKDHTDEALSQLQASQVIYQRTYMKACKSCAARREATYR